LVPNRFCHMSCKDEACVIKPSYSALTVFMPIRSFSNLSNRARVIKSRSTLSAACGDTSSAKKSSKRFFSCVKSSCGIFDVCNAVRTLFVILKSAS
jgi:hypothetical protein